MGKNESRMDQLRKKRTQARSARDQDRLRTLHGEELVAVVAEAFGKPLLLDNFNSESVLWPIEWPSDIREATGLVAAYISRSDANGLLACVRDKLRTLSGKVGFHEKPYLGFAQVHEVDPMALLAVAESTEDSVVFYSDAPTGIVMVDCYMSQPSEPFSIIVQGEELVKRLNPCFQGIGEPKTRVEN